MHKRKDLSDDLDLSFVPKYQSLAEIMADNNLAALGDAFVNFIYSLALSVREGKPVGKKLSNLILASALRRSGLRSLMPFRMDRHQQANAAEALIVYAWLKGVLSLLEILQIISIFENIEDAFVNLLQKIVQKSRIS